MNKFGSLFGAAILALASMPANAALFIDDDPEKNRKDWEEAVSLSGLLFVEDTFSTIQDSNEDGVMTFVESKIISSASSATSGIVNKVLYWNSTPPTPSPDSNMYAGKVGNGSSGSESITWTFQDPTFGFFGDFYEVNSLSAWVGTDQFEIPGNNNGQGLTTFGILSTVSFTQIVWSLGTGAANDSFLIDDFSYTGATDPGSPVPAPAALWLFGTGLLGLIGFNRRSKAA
jgi:hypothetical protein